MPIYDYACPCGKKVPDVYRSMHNPDPQPCPDCGAAMERVPTLPSTDLKEFHTPIEMYSVAVDSIEEARELKVKCPDADISDDPSDPMCGVPIARSRKAKMQVLAAIQFREVN